MNSISLIGNICNDLELKQTTSGKSVLSFNLAVSRPHVKDVTDFIPTKVWGQAAEYLATYAKKGVRIGISGKLTTSKYVDKSGNNRTAFEVEADTAEICSSSRENAAGAKGENAANVPNPASWGNKNYMPDAYTQPGLNTAQFEEISNDEALPF